MTSQQSQPTDEKTIRAAVFRDVQVVEEVTRKLLETGFTREQISVLCSEDAKERHFREFEHEEPAGTHTPEDAARGGAAGALFGGLVTIGVATAAGLPLLAAGPSFLIGGAVAGGFIGAMRSRGEEGALADFYDQALTRGDLLVAVEDDKPGSHLRLQQAEQIFADAGAASFPLEPES
jgi:hypothetical protein